MGRTVAEVENVVHSGDADVFTGNAQHSRFTPLSRVINRVPKDRASAPPQFYVVARHPSQVSHGLHSSFIPVPRHTGQGAVCSLR
jgi:hypothetical protein